jgi:hypothetical protein
VFGGVTYLLLVAIIRVVHRGIVVFDGCPQPLQSDWWRVLIVQCITFQDGCGLFASDLVSKEIWEPLQRNYHLLLQRSFHIHIITCPRSMTPGVSRAFLRISAKTDTFPGW